MITETYFKQCEKAEEIQKLWRPQLGDWFYSKEVDDAVQILGFTKESRRVIDKGIWLPTQEQLQEMAWQTAEGRHEYTYCISKHFRKSYFTLCVLQVRHIGTDNSIIAKYTGESIHECLLQSIYDFKYNKVWTGEDWQISKKEVNNG